MPIGEVCNHSCRNANRAAIVMRVAGRLWLQAGLWRRVAERLRRSAGDFAAREGVHCWAHVG